MGKVYIRSQDREELVLFGDGLNSIYYQLKPEIPISQNAGIQKQHAVVVMGNNVKHCLGIYESKERCLAVLDEIQQKCAAYHRINALSHDLLFDMPTVYEMPE